MYWSFLAHLNNESRQIIMYLQELELEVRGVPWNYNWWLGVEIGMITPANQNDPSVYSRF